MRRNSIIQITIVALLAVLLLSGCAGTARGKKTSVYQHNEALSVVDLSKSQADAMVVIRYPAFVDVDALTAYYRSFEQNVIGGSFKRDSQINQETERIAQSVVAKSSYYSMSLYRELRDRLPDQSVLLSPHIVELTDDNKLISRPLLAAEEIPSVVTIDFNVYSFPDPRKMMDSEPLTFGDIVTPLFVIHANRWLRPSTHGLLLSSEPLAGPAWSQSRLQVKKQVAARLDDSIHEFKRPLDFVAFLDSGYQPLPRLKYTRSRKYGWMVNSWPR
jgi:hypothetical protein